MQTLTMLWRDEQDDNAASETNKEKEIYFE
jgi:hypothetical protein